MARAIIVNNLSPHVYQQYANLKRNSLQIELNFLPVVSSKVFLRQQPGATPPPPPPILRRTVQNVIECDTFSSLFDFYLLPFK